MSGEFPIRAILGLALLVLALILVRDTGSTAEENQKMPQELGLKEATFAGGCFWCMQPPFDRLPGVKKTYAGYTGGTVENPTYQQVSSGDTGHAESVLVVYDPQLVTYEKLLETFWRNIDPTQIRGQFADRGSEYRTAIYYHDDEQRKLAEQSKYELERSKKFDKPIVTTIEPASAFYRAEEEHQDYYKKSAIHYKLYKMGSGRADYLKRTWGEDPPH